MGQAISRDIHIRTNVLPGGRIEVVSPALPEGSPVEMVVHIEPQPAKPKGGVLEFLASLPASTRAMKDWDAFEKHFRAERDAWD